MDKVLPSVFAQGYLDTLIEIMGYSMVKASTIQAFKDEQFNSDLDEIIKSPVDLDYNYLRSIYSGLQIMMLNDSQVDVISFTRNIGRIWWSPSSPLMNRYWQKNSLYELCSPNILQSLQDYKEERSITQKIRVALESFVDVMVDRGKFDIQISSTSSTFELRLLGHPFYHRNVQDCFVFCGIIEGFLDWMYGFNPSQSSTLSRLFYLDPENISVDAVTIHI